jgi:hypothetical protein
MPGARLVWRHAAVAWVGAVLLAFLVIRMLGSTAVQHLLRGAR